MYDDDDESECEPRELPTMNVDGSCCVCGKPGQQSGCFRCGLPVCMVPGDYMADSACGSWILDWWHDSAFDADDGNEFWCKVCLEEVYGKP